MLIFIFSSFLESLFFVKHILKPLPCWVLVGLETDLRFHLRRFKKPLPAFFRSSTLRGLVERSEKPYWESLKIFIASFHATAKKFVRWSENRILGKFSRVNLTDTKRRNRFQFEILTSSIVAQIPPVCWEPSINQALRSRLVEFGSTKSLLYRQMGNNANGQSSLKSFARHALNRYPRKLPTMFRFSHFNARDREWTRRLVRTCSVAFTKSAVITPKRTEFITIPPHSSFHAAAIDLERAIITVFKLTSKQKPSSLRQFVVRRHAKIASDDEVT